MSKKSLLSKPKKKTPLHSEELSLDIKIIVQMNTLFVNFKLLIFQYHNAFFTFNLTYNDSFFFF